MPAAHGESRGEADASEACAVNPPPCHDFDASEWVDEDSDLGPVIREQATRQERTRWLSWAKVAVAFFGLWFIGCYAGAFGSGPWCD